MGDSLSFTLTARFRKYMGGGLDTRNHCSGYYTGGEVTALAFGLGDWVCSRSQSTTGYRWGKGGY